MKEKKQPHKSREQVAAEMKQVMEARRLRAFAKSKFYPFLIAHTNSIADARTFLQVIDTVVNSAFNEARMKIKIGEMKLVEKIRSTAPDDKQELYKSLFEMFKDETVLSFGRVVSDFNQVIGGLVEEWQRAGKLSDLKSPFPEDRQEKK